MGKLKSRQFLKTSQGKRKKAQVLRPGTNDLEERSGYETTTTSWGKREEIRLPAGGAMITPGRVEAI